MNSVGTLIDVIAAAAAQPFMCSCNIRLCVQSGSKITSHSLLNKRQAVRTALLQMSDRTCKCSGKKLDNVSV